MAWHHKPRDRCECLPEGEWGVVIENVERKESKTGNDMVEMTYSAKWAEKTVILKDWLVKGWHVEKTRAIATALGKVEMLDAGEFRLSHQRGAHLWVKVKHENSDGYGWNARIEAYIDPGPEGPPEPADPFKYQTYETPEQSPF